MSILIVGSEGSMGHRYKALLSYMGRGFRCVDAIDGEKAVIEIANSESIDGVIIASPTHTHGRYLEVFSALKKPILCEKPIAKSVPYVCQLLRGCHDGGTPVRMMMQYKELVPEQAIGDSHYNYFRHGNDGLVWDCMQIIGLSKGPVTLEETSPFWTCVVNGHALSIRDMDEAYYRYLKRWFSCPQQAAAEIITAHAKTKEFETAYAKRSTKIYIGIQARSTSERFPRKVFELIDGRPMIRHVIDACNRSAGYINRFSDKHGMTVGVALLIPKDDEIKRAFGSKTMIVEGDEQDVLSRYQKLQAETDSDYVIRVTGDCPLIPHFVITKIINCAVLNECDYVSNVDERLRTAADGMDCEAISKRLLQWVYERASESSDREHVTTYMRRSPPPWAKINSVVGFLDLSTLKLSVDTKDDLEAVRAQYEKLKRAIEEGSRLFGKNAIHRF